MTTTPSFSQLLSDAEWLAHRYDPEHDAFHFIQVPRQLHRDVTFLTDEYLPPSLSSLVISRADAMRDAPTPAPIHFIFHSAFCLSTVLARAFDFPGKSMCLKEPVALNDLVGWRYRGGDPARIAEIMDNALALLARPFEAGEAVIIKPSNILNGLAQAMLRLRPDAKALFIHAPLETFVKSVAKKGMAGRLWIRDLYVKQLKEGLIRLNFDNEQYLGLTDLQVAAVCWLAQHALFEALANHMGPERLVTLNSEVLLQQPEKSISAISRHFGLMLSIDDPAKIAKGPAFSEHSKSKQAFGAQERAQEYARATELYGDEIDKVVTWAKAVAENAGVAMTLPNALRLDGR